MPEPTAQSFQPTAPTAQLVAPEPIKKVEVPGQVQKYAEGKFEDDPMMQVYKDQLEAARETNKLIREGLQQQFAGSLQQYQEQAKKIEATSKQQLANIGALGTTTAGAQYQTELAGRHASEEARMKSEQATQMALVGMEGHKATLDIIEKQYGAQDRKQAEALAYNLEVQKENAKIEMMNTETQMAVAKFNEDSRLKGEEAARQNAAMAGYVVTQDGQLLPTLEKEQQVNQKIESDRRFQFDVSVFEAEKAARAQELAIKAAALTGEYEGVKTLGARQVELEALRTDEAIKAEKEKIALEKNQQAFSQAFDTKNQEIQERAQSFSEAMDTAKQLLDEKLANQQIKASDYNIAMEWINTQLNKKMTSQKIKESDADIALKKIEALRKETLLPAELDAMKAETERMKAQTTLTLKEASKAAGSAASTAGSPNYSPSDADLMKLDNVLIKDESGNLRYDLDLYSTYTQKERQAVDAAFNWQAQQAAIAAKEIEEMHKKMLQGLSSGGGAYAPIDTGPFKNPSPAPAAVGI